LVTKFDKYLGKKYTPKVGRAKKGLTVFFVEKIREELEKIKE
jgi:hypothetical protein